MESAQPDDSALLARVEAGDDAALGAVYDRYARPVYSLILRIVGNQQVAEDLTQETFLRVWRQATTYRPERGRFASWIMTIAHNLAIDEVRRARKLPIESPMTSDGRLPDLQVADNSPRPEDVALGGVARDYILRALQSLPTPQRQVVELAYFSGLTQAEIATRTGEPLGTVKTRMRLALQKLHAALVAEGVELDTL